MPKQPKPSDDYNLATEVARSLIPQARTAEDRQSRWFAREAALLAIRAARIFWSDSRSTVKASVAEAVAEEKRREDLVAAS